MGGAADFLEGQEALRRALARLEHWIINKLEYWILHLGESNTGRKYKLGEEWMEPMDNSTK